MPDDQIERARLRTLTAAAFIPSRIDTTWRPLADETAGDFLDSIAACDRPLDLMHMLAFPLPVRIICRILGIPEDDAPVLRAWSTALLDGSNTDGDQRRSAHADIDAYLADTISWYTGKGPADTLLADLIAARDGDGDRLTPGELVATVHTILLAGHAVMASIIGTGVFTLLTSPGRWAGLVADPGRARDVVEEILRREVPGYPEGRTLVSEGAGVDYELGINLARVVHAAAFGTLAARIPTLRLHGDPDSILWTTAKVRGPVELPVTW